MKTFDEQWKPVEGFENYEISSIGRVKSLKYGVEKILKPGMTKDGYLFVILCRNGKMKYFKVHHLVASAFIPNPERFPEVNHKDEVKTNNVVDNLEWVSRWYNINYGTRNERAASARRNDPARSKAVEASRYSDFRTIELRFASTMEAKRNGYDRGGVSACCRGCYSTHRGNFYKGLYWRYAS